MYITLRCQKCDNIECPIARNYVPYDSLEGCTRQVSQEIYGKWQNLMIETLPFLHLRQITAPFYEEINLLENEVYSSRLGRKIDMNGKALPEPIHSSNLPQLCNAEEEGYQEDTPYDKNEARPFPDILSLGQS